MRRRLLVLAVFFALFVGYIGLSKPATVQAACPVGRVCTTPVSSGAGPSNLFDDGRLNNSDPWETAAIYCLADGSVRVYVIGNPWHIAFTASPAAIINSSITPPDAGAGQSGLGSASVILEGIGIYYYFSHSSGHQAILISQGMGASLYRLPNGMLQVNSPGLNPKDGDYNFIFKECPGLPTGPLSMAVEIDGTRISDVIDVRFGSHSGSGSTQPTASGGHGIGTNQNSSSITITAALSKNQLLSDWRKALLNGKVERKTVAIVYFKGGKEIERITFSNCYPVSWKLSGGQSVADSRQPNETVQLTCLGAKSK